MKFVGRNKLKRARLTLPAPFLFMEDVFTGYPDFRPVSHPVFCRQ